MENPISNIKIDSSQFHMEIQRAFKSSPLTFSNALEIVNKLNEYKDKAFELFKQGKFYDSACIYKGLLEKCIENLGYIEDKEGKIGDFLFQIIFYFSKSIENLNIDLNNFFEDSVNIFITEDYGFSNELIKLTFSKIDLYNYTILENILISKIAKTDSSYIKEKIINFLLSLYNAINDDKKYLDTCKTLPDNGWERYVYIAEKYFQMGQLDRAVETYESGLQKTEYHKELLEEKYSQFKKKLLGL